MKKSNKKCCGKAVNQNGKIYNIQNCRGGGRGVPNLPHSCSNSIQNSKGGLAGGKSKYLM